MGWFILIVLFIIVLFIMEKYLLGILLSIGIIGMLIILWEDRNSFGHGANHSNRSNTHNNSNSDNEMLYWNTINDTINHSDNRNEKISHHNFNDEYSYHWDDMEATYEEFRDEYDSREDFYDDNDRD